MSSSTRKRGRCPAHCFLPGTLLVTDNNHHISRRGFKLLDIVRDVDGNPFAIISARR